jgi:hypothetical protein
VRLSLLYQTLAQIDCLLKQAVSKFDQGSDAIETARDFRIRLALVADVVLDLGPDVLELSPNLELD